MLCIIALLPHFLRCSTSMNRVRAWTAVGRCLSRTHAKLLKRSPDAQTENQAFSALPRMFDNSALSIALCFTRCGSGCAGRATGVFLAGSCATRASQPQSKLSIANNLRLSHFILTARSYAFWCNSTWPLMPDRYCLII